MALRTFVDEVRVVRFFLGTAQMCCESMSVRPENTACQFKCVARTVRSWHADGPPSIKEKLHRTIRNWVGLTFCKADGPVSWILVKRMVRPGISDGPPYIFRLDQGRSVRPTGWADRTAWPACKHYTELILKLYILQCVMYWNISYYQDCFN